MKPELTYHVGQRKVHEMTGMEIKLLSPTRKGWYVQVVSTLQPDYNVNIDSESLSLRFKDLPE